MTKIKSISEIGSLYESILSNENLIEEKRNGKKYPKNSFLPSHEEAKEPKSFKNSGPGAALKGIKKKVAKKSKKNTRKTVKEDINSFMKSKFDRLFENVMDDDKDLDLGAGPGSGPEGEAGDLDSDLDTDMDSEMDSDMGGEEVTLTLDKETAQKLIDVLQAAVGGGEDMLGGEEDTDLEDLEIEDEGGEDEFGFGDEDEDEDEETKFNDAVESEKLPDSKGHTLTKGNSVTGHFGKASKEKASSEVTDETGNSTLSDKTGHVLTKSGNNKVSSSVTDKAGKPLF